ncbi:hypothetical protein Hanom_Chr05g00434171 [Helianthus anomalus]
MSCTGRSTIRSVLTARDLESFVETYKIPERFSPTLPGPDDSAECTPDRIVLHPVGLVTFSKRKDNISRPCYSFMPTLTYPKEWKSRVFFVSSAMMLESPPLRDAKAAIEDSIPVLAADEIVQWKRMYENPMRTFTFPEGVLAMGG